MGSEKTQFKPGQSGNPGGRPKGVNTRVKEMMAERVDKAFAVLDANLALGDLNAAKMVLDRMLPTLKSVEHKGSQSVEQFLLGLVKDSMKDDNNKKESKKADE